MDLSLLRSLVAVADAGAITEAAGRLGLTQPARRPQYAQRCRWNADAFGEYGQFDKKLVLVGQGNKLELWSEALWIEERDRALDDIGADDDLPDELIPFFPHLKKQIEP